MAEKHWPCAAYHPITEMIIPLRSYWKALIPNICDAGRILLLSTRVSGNVEWANTARMKMVILSNKPTTSQNCLSQNSVELAF